MKTILSLLLFVLAVPASVLAQHSHHHPSTDRPSTHGMLMVGQSEVFLSHLPMFHSPHDYQVLLKVDLGPAALAAYRRDRQAHPNETVYTLVPETFVLPDMVANPRPFRAQIFRGHFERGGVPIANVAAVRITQVVHFHKFPKSAARPSSSRYLLFGNASEQFVAHLITAKPPAGEKPEFDHVLAVRASNTKALDRLAQGALALEIPQLDNGTPLPAGAPITAVVADEPAQPVPLTGIEELYLEFGDLAM